MTQHNSSKNQATNTRPGFRRMLRALSIAASFGGIIALSNDAQAEQRCTSKPAVCALNKSKAAQQPKVASKEVKSVVRVKRCDSKPAVCALQRATEPKTVVKTEVVRAQPAVKRCDSKPAVCALQRSRATAKAQN
jgi:hypothetical protein